MAKDRPSAVELFWPVVRSALFLLLWPVLLFAWWLGQGCVDDPCVISAANEWRGLVVLAVVGAVVLRLASRRWWIERIGLWLASGVVLYLLNGDATSDVNDPIYTEAPRLGLTGARMLFSWIGVMVLTLVLEAAVAFRSRKTAPRGPA